MPKFILVSTVTSYFNKVISVIRSCVVIKDGDILNKKAMSFVDHALESKTKVLNLKSQESALSSEIENLENNLDQQNNWEKTKNQYYLKQIARGAYAYVSYSDRNQNEVFQYLCADCFKNKIKSILKPIKASNNNTTNFVCPSCKTVIRTTKETRN